MVSQLQPRMLQYQMGTHRVLWAQGKGREHFPALMEKENQLGK